MSRNTTRRGNFGAKVVPIQRGRHVTQPKRSYVQLSDELRTRVTRELFALKLSGQLDAAAYERISTRTGASVSQLEKLLRAAVRNAEAGGDALPDPRTGRASKVEITNEVLLCHVGRDLTSAHMLAMARGLIEPCHRTTYVDAVRKHVGDGVLKGLRYGQRVLPEQWVYLDRRENPLMDQLTIDLFFPRVRATLADGTSTVPVWIAVRERSRGLLLAWHLFHRAPRNAFDVDGDPTTGPDAAAVLALLGEAMRGWTYDGVFCGGLPRALRCDREALFLTPESRAELMALGIEVDPTNSYSSWENGAHERMHQVIRREALQGMPASNNGPQTRAKKLHFAEAAVSFDELDERLTRWAMSYNFERPNTAVGGLTPFDSWRERLDAGDTVTRASNRELAPLSLPAGTATKQKNGLALPGTGFAYSGDALVGVRRGTEFALGKWLNDDRHLEVFDPATGAYFATLERTADMSAEAEGRVMHARHRERETVKDILAEALRRARIEDGATSPRPQPAEQLPEAAEAAEAVEDAVTDPPVGRHAVRQHPVDCADRDGPDSSLDEPVPFVPVDLDVPHDRFAARLAAAADNE